MIGKLKEIFYVLFVNLMLVFSKIMSSKHIAILMRQVTDSSAQSKEKNWMLKYQIKKDKTRSYNPSNKWKQDDKINLTELMFLLLINIYIKIIQRSFLIN